MVLAPPRKVKVMASFDYDVLIIGSGFGGSVAALRAAEKGYRVGVMRGQTLERRRHSKDQLGSEALRVVSRSRVVRDSKDRIPG
jgi:choline dehydrogenase-like flavoprotein